jgi:uncharacterized membrane protein YtjA (UPF0391 family)
MRCDAEDLRPELAAKYAGWGIGTTTAPSQNPFTRAAALFRAHPPGRNDMMLRWALGFFLIAIVAAIFGFGGIALAAAGMAKILFFIFLVLFLVALLGGLVRRA